MAPLDSSTHDTSSDSSSASSDPDVHVHSINRVVELPVVKSALGVASGLYTRVKGYNTTLETGLSRAEQTVQLVADTAKPVIQKLEKPINYADDLVCQGLDKLEEKVPSIKKSPDELKTAGWGTYEAVVTYGTETLDSVKTYVTTHATAVSETQVAHVLIKSVDSALEIAESALDNYLPPGAEEDQQQQNGGGADQPPAGTPAAVINRVSRVSDKMRKRLLRTDLLLVKRAMGLLTPVKELTSH